jgi:hypothetical protein
MATALRCAVPLFGLFVLWVLGVALATLLLIVPGLILLTMWLVAPVSLVVERTGIMASFGRSRALTKGSRWQIFGIFIVLILASMAVRALLAPVVGTTDGGLPTLSFAVADAVVSGVASLVLTVVVAAIYVELRTVKEGASTANLAAIFA